MPRGGHHGGWFPFPNPKMGILEHRPAWKKFAGPQRVPGQKGAFLKQSWVLNVNKDPKVNVNLPSRDENNIKDMYEANRTMLALPLQWLSDECPSISNKWRCLSRSLDFDRGLARNEYVNVDATSHFNIIADSPKKGYWDDPTKFWQILANRRMYRLCQQYQTTWKPWTPPTESKHDNKEDAFPYVDENASVMADLGLKDILHSRHKTRTRRHPKWVEIQWWLRKWKNAYLHRRRIKIVEDEAKSLAERSKGITSGK
eukprot:GEMP01058209.1.p1 GENE.GEMP01058209.1~~GEMP01058209.1.p1  ORF type:complete len:257 (+),score=23.62 GEMP01058209.1:119-889(+)